MGTISDNIHYLRSPEIEKRFAIHEAAQIRMQVLDAINVADCAQDAYQRAEQLKQVGEFERAGRLYAAAHVISEVSAELSAIIKEKMKAAGIE